MPDFQQLTEGKSPAGLVCAMSISSAFHILGWTSRGWNITEHRTCNCAEGVCMEPNTRG